MELADLGKGDHAGFGRGFDLPRDGFVPLQGEMRSQVVVVFNVALENAGKMALAERDDMSHPFPLN